MHVFDLIGRHAACRSPGRVARRAVVVRQPLVVEVGDQVARRVSSCSCVSVEEGELIAQVVLQRLRPRRHVLHGVVLLVALLVDALARRPVLLVEVVVPVLVERFQAVEVELVVAIVLERCRRDRIAPRLRRRSPAIVLDRAALLSVPSLQDRVLLQLLLDRVPAGP